jgi:hypothetical protein
MSNKEIKNKHIDELHFEHKQWINELKFYKEDLGSFNNRLSEVVSRNTDSEVLAKLEHFQNKFIIQERAADELLDELRNHERELAVVAAENPVAIDHRRFSDHTKLREDMGQFVKIYRDLRNEYMTYLSEVM